MQKWEYLEADYHCAELECVNGVESDPAAADRATAPDEWLNQRGEEGWELVAVSVHGDGAEAFYLKRPKRSSLSST